MADNLFELKVITPDRVFYEGQAYMVEMNTSEGQIGVYKNHIPLTCALEPGVLTVHEEAGAAVKKAAVHEGFVTILKDSVTILAEEAEWPEEIDRHRAEEAKVRAERRLNSGDGQYNRLRAEVALKKALVRLSLTK